jgi:hypothetical protein
VCSQTRNRREDGSRQLCTLLGERKRNAESSSENATRSWLSFRTGSRRVSSPHCLFWSLELATASLLTSGPLSDTQAQLRNRAPKKLRNMDAAGRSMWQSGPSTEIAL